jgi:hypothetical protein
VTTEFGGFYEFEGERVKRGRVIVNMNDVGIQIGAAPASGSRAERLALAMQRLNARRNQWGSSVIRSFLWTLG